jgi:protein disulfide-isomerase A1
MLTLASIISYMTKQALPAVSTLTSDTLDEFKTQDKVVLVAYFALDDKTSNETFSKIADTMRDDFLFGATNDATLAEAAGVKQPGLVMYKDFDDGTVNFDKKFDTEAIEEFVKTSSIPLVGEVGPETYAGYMAVSAISTSCPDSKLTRRSRPVCPLALSS